MVSNDRYKIVENNINRVLSKKDKTDLAFITAFRTSLGKSLKENRKENKELEKGISNLGYKGYTKVVEYYNEQPDIEGTTPDKEESFILWKPEYKSFDDFVFDVVSLCKKYKQQSVLVWNHNDKIAYLFDENGNILDTFNDIRVDIISQAWTKVGNHNLVFESCIYNVNGNSLTATIYNK